MHVVLYVKGFPPRETGGPVEVAAHVARGVLGRNHLRLTLVVQTDSTEEEIRRVLGDPANLAVLRLPYFPTVREVFALRLVLRAFASADVIHFNEFPFRHVPLILWAKLRGVPTVFSMHGLLSREIRTFLGPAYPLTLHKRGDPVQVHLPRAAIDGLLVVYKWFSHAWAAIVVPSEALKREAASLDGFPQARISVIPHGVAAPVPPPSPPVAHAGPLRILFVGKLEAVKGPDLLLDAAGRLLSEGISLEVSIVGAGSLDAQLRARATALGLERVSFLGARHGAELGSLYAACDLVVVPSRHETLSLVVLEAMAAGRPVLATKVGGIPEVAKEPRNALLVPPDSDALAGSLRRLIEDPDLRAAMSRANLVDASRRSWSQVVDVYVRLYRRLLGASGLGRT